YQSLGPQDENGARVGGRYLLVASAELEVRIVGAYGAALFFDAGNAGDSPRPELSRGVGIGARWRSPVGVVGIDIAHPLDDPDTDFRLHLSVGSDLRSARRGGSRAACAARSRSSRRSAGGVPAADAGGAPRGG